MRRKVSVSTLVVIAISTNLAAQPAITSAPELTNPPDGATGTSLTPELRWNPVSGAAKYDVQVGPAEGFSDPIIFTDKDGTDFVIGDDKLQTGSTYYWRIRGRNPSSRGPWSETWSFTTGLGKPEAIVLTSPSDGATDVSATPNLIWEADPVADQYKVQVALDEEFNNRLHNIEVATTNWMPPALSNATKHWWRVRGLNASGSGPFSEARSFTVEAGGPTQVKLSSPSNGASNVELDPVLDWSAVSGGQPYHLQLSKMPDFSSTIIDDSNVNSTQYDVSGLDGSTTYYWRVLAASAPPQNWSETWSFTTGTGTPAQIIPISPADGATEVPISTSFSWEADAVAETYRLQVSTNSDFSDPQINTPGITETNFTPPDVLDSGTLYYWHVRGINSVGSGPYSDTRSFTTAASAPGAVTLTSPADNATNVSATPTFVWQAEAESDSYDIQIATTEDFAAPVVSASGLTETEFTSSALAYGTPHFWRARGSNSAGKGPWSAKFAFTTTAGGPQQVVLVSPANGATDVGLAPLLSWGAVTNAASYALQVSKQSNFSSTVINRDAVTTTQFQTSELDGEMRHYWRVRASNAGPANWSQTWSFVTSPGIPNQVTLLSPVDKAQNVTVNTVLKWNQAQKADSYHLQLTRIEDDFSEIFYDASGITGTEHQVPELIYGDVYWWRVRAENESGAGPWSETWGYLTERGGPHQPLIIAPEPGETGVPLDPLLVWSSVPEELSKGAAVTYHVQVATSFSFAGGSIVAEESANADTTFQVNELLPDTTYAWRVRASVAGPNNWTITSSFVTGKGVPGKVVLGSPEDGATEIPLETQLTWNVPQRATSFNLQVSLDSTFTSVIVSETGLSDVTFMLVDLDPLTSHYWRVQAVNQDGVGEWSDIATFETVGLAPPAPPVLVSPLNGAEEVSHMPLFTWNASEGASSYKLEISTSATFTTVAIAVVVSQPFYQAEGLLLGQEYFWRVEARNAGGSSTSDTWGFTTVQSTDSEAEELPDAFAVGQNYPNPFNPSTTIEFSMPKAAHARLVVYNVRGEEVTRLVDGFVPAGHHRVVWNAVDLPSGVYLYRFQAEDFVVTKKLALAK